MHRNLLDVLVDPLSDGRLRLDPTSHHGDVVEEGLLSSDSGAVYVIRNGIPRFVSFNEDDQSQTGTSFAFKWSMQSTYESSASVSRARAWLLERYGFPSEEAMRSFFECHSRTLDLGCGSGFSSSLWLDRAWSGVSAWVGVDISAAIDIAAERLGGIPGTHFVQADALHLPFEAGTFDAVISEGVLHHTPSTKAALEEATRVLAPGGEILFYVYRRKGPIREMTDDYVRAQISGMPPAEAWEALKPLTALGQALAEAKATVTVERAVPLLGIDSGTIDVQRLVYWNFAKLFWNDDLTFDENHHINFDWYHPRYAHRQTEEELREWCRDSGLVITRWHAQESGFTVRAVRSSSLAGTSPGEP